MSVSKTRLIREGWYTVFVVVVIVFVVYLGFLGYKGGIHGSRTWKIYCWKIYKYIIFSNDLPTAQWYQFSALLAKKLVLVWTENTKGTPGFIHCLFMAASLATLNKQMPSSFATYDALSLVNHKAKLHLVWLHIVDICSALVNSW